MLAGGTYAQTPVVHTSGLESAPTHQRFIVQYKDGAGVTTPAVAQQRLAAALASAPATLQSDVIVPGNPSTAAPTVLREMAPGGYVVTSSTALTPFAAEQWMQKIAADPQVRFVQVDVVAYPKAQPNDRYYPQQEHLFGAQGMRGDRAWSMTRGAGVVVAIIDSGITPHPDLDAALLPGYDFVNLDADPTVKECAGTHATYVAGTIAAVTNNARGVASVAPDTRIVPIQVAPGCAHGSYASDKVSAIRWAVGQEIGNAPINANPAEVINISRGGEYECPVAVQEAIDHANTKGAVVVISAGNESISADRIGPGNCRNVLSVGAVDAQGRRSYFSNFGPTVDLAAPGQIVWPSADDRTYEDLQGTSFSAPMVSAVAAMMQSAASKTLTPARIETLLKESARPFPSTPDKPIGAGILDATAAVSYAMHETYETLNGAYVIHSVDKKCLMVGNEGNDTVPSFDRWWNTTYAANNCGLGDAATLMANKQAVWHFTPIETGVGMTAYVIRSAVNQKCLIRGSNGYAEQAELFSWPVHADKTWCGFPTREALVANGQALWFLDKPSKQTSFGLTHTHTGLKTVRPSFAYLLKPGGWEQRFGDARGTWDYFELHEVSAVDANGIPRQGMQVPIVMGTRCMGLDAIGDLSIPLREQECTTPVGQRFVYKEDRLHVADDQRLCLGPWNSQTAAGTLILTAWCTLDATQRWSIDAEGRIRNRHVPSLCMSTDNDGYAYNLVCDQAPRQRFKFKLP
ncbi:S8 family serine peptidase [Lysobacter sp. A6]|uniref:S8 family serine peptidase n=1 Tax=Noviluteimonas lactosilytica TaxID=2888523 RepID=A0ABS8JIN3_9GAMM|nr:S8 family serine peptidase [Lysobacter lactosilyticus]MCC8363468.1 S8 family serine peptidase [Lysobacter lactosilyticus]